MTQVDVLLRAIAQGQGRAEADLVLKGGRFLDLVTGRRLVVHWLCGVIARGRLLDRHIGNVCRGRIGWRGGDDWHLLRLAR